MIRISTTQIRVGDRVRLSVATEGTVIEYRPSINRPFMVISNENGNHRCHMTSAGSVELLSDLDGREPCKPFGRW